MGPREKVAIHDTHYNYVISVICYSLMHRLLTSFSESKPVNTRIPTTTDSLLRACSLIIMTPFASFSSPFTSLLADVECDNESPG